MKSATKETIASAFSAVATILVFLFWKRAVPFVAAGSFSDYGLFVAPMLVLVLSASLFAVAASFVRIRPILRAGVAGSFAAGVFLIPDAAGSWPARLSGVGAAALLALFAARRIHQEYLFSLDFSIAKILKAGLPIYFTAIALVVSVLYYGTVTDREKAISSVIPRGAVELGIRALSGAVGDLDKIPGEDPVITVDEFLAGNLRRQMGEQGVPENAANTREVAELLAQQRNELARRYGIPIQGGERLSDVLHRTITARVQDLLGPYARFLPVLSAAAFFFAFKAFTFPLYFASLILTALLIKLLAALSIVKRTQETVAVERMSFS